MANILTCSSFKEFIKENHKFGLVEFFVCSLSILSPYGIGVLNFSIVLPIFIGYLALKREKHKFCVNYYPFVLLFSYMILHEIFLCLFLDSIPSHHINSMMVLILMLAPTFIVAKSINFDLFVNTLFLISFVVVLGIFYHVIIIMAGGEVEPIRIPFLPFNEESTRLTELGQRPKSFFLEPSNVNNFLMFPLFLSLYYRKFKIAVFFILGILLTTSTNGLVTTSVMVLVFLFTQKVGVKTWLLVLLIIPLFVAIYMTSNVFEQGRAKVESTDVQDNVRTINGPLLVAGMPKEHLILGFPAANVNDYISLTNYVSGVDIIINKDGSTFVSAFWMILAKYGFVGMFFFLFAHYKLYLQCKGLILYFIPAFLLMFSGGVVSMSGSLFGWTVFILSFASYDIMNSQKNQNYSKKRNTE